MERADGWRDVEVRAGRLSDSSALLRRAEARSRAHSGSGRRGWRLAEGAQGGNRGGGARGQAGGSAVECGWAARNGTGRESGQQAGFLAAAYSCILLAPLSLLLFLPYPPPRSLPQPSLGVPPHSFPRILTAACALFPLYLSSCPWTLSSSFCPRLFF